MSPFRLIALAGVLVAVFAGAQAQTRGGKTIAIDAQSIELGMGFDSLRGEFITDKKCIVYADAERGGVKTQVSLTEVTDKHSLGASLSIDASLQVDMLLGTVKGEGKVSFVGEREMATSSQSFSAYARASSQERYAAPVASDGLPAALLANGGSANAALGRTMAEIDATVADGTLPASAEILLAEKYAQRARDDRDGFFRACGDSFVRVMRGGAEVIGLVTFVTSSLKTQSEIRTAMSASGSGWEASAEAKQKLSEYQESGRLQLNYYETGGKDEDVPTDWEGILDRVRAVKQLAQTPRFYEVEIVPYATLDNWPGVADVDEPERDPLLYHYAAYQTVFKAAESALSDPNRHRNYLLGRGTTVLGVEHLSDEMADRIGELAPRLAACGDTTENKGAADCSADGLPDPYAFRLHLPLAFAPPDSQLGPYMTEAFLETRYLKDAMADQLLRAPRDGACAFAGNPGCIKRARLRELEAELAPTDPAPAAFETFLLGTRYAGKEEGCLIVPLADRDKPIGLWGCVDAAERGNASEKFRITPVSELKVEAAEFSRECVVALGEGEGSNLTAGSCEDASGRPTMRWRMVDFTPTDDPAARLREGLLINSAGLCLKILAGDGPPLAIQTGCDPTDRGQRWTLKLKP